MSVATQPGQTALTSTPRPARSAASSTVSMSSAALDTEYAGTPPAPPVSPKEPAPLETLTIRPPRGTSGASAIAVRHAPTRSVSRASRTTRRSAVTADCPVS
ncbi:hypothetical protein SAMN06893096_10273 [Geodermatophilus pulveris]|uniref:Uncharacterized protein n=1 Tax=Geodermatophilus pulveris TaxID=1564159 RepID=A0A239BTR1_9ACTN|nr:hypothetical protein SAMN06893096_10273 [Geodermatophilus pulveris]